MKPRLLDLFCGAGGAAMGYHRAGFEVVGVDLAPQPHYPFEFIQADAMTYPLEGFDVIHASPPCQDHSPLSKVVGTHDTGWMLPATLDRLREHGVPWVVENVGGARRSMGGHWFQLCGVSFGLQVETDRGLRWLRRHRLFASSSMVLTPSCACRGRPTIGVYGHADGANAARETGWTGSTKDREVAMGIDWMTSKELAQAIPPAYTEWIGTQLLASAHAA